MKKYLVVLVVVWVSLGLLAWTDWNNKLMLVDAEIILEESVLEKGYYTQDEILEKIKIESTKCDEKYVDDQDGYTDCMTDLQTWMLMEQEKTDNILNNP